MNAVRKIVFFVFCSFFLCAVSLFAQEGYLRITSTPEGASVEIAGKNIGKTPVLTALKPGKYTYKLSLTDYEVVSGTAEVLENEVTKVDITLVKKAQALPAKPAPVKPLTGKGKLTILTDWQDVTIYLNGHRIDEKPPVTLKDVPAGLNNVILVSGDYADSFRILVSPGKTSVLKKNFEEDKNRYLSQPKTVETPVEVPVIPAKIIVTIDTPTSQDTKTKDTTILGESDVIEVVFRYKKTDQTEWNEKTLQTGTKTEETFELEKGIYEIQLTATHYKVPTGLLNVLLTKKEKVREYKEVMKKEIQPEMQYKYKISYDGKSFGYKIEETKLPATVK